MKKGTFCPGCQTRDKRAPLLSRTGVPGWETGTTAVSQPGQINVFQQCQPLRCRIGHVCQGRGERHRRAALQGRRELFCVREGDVLTILAGRCCRHLLSQHARYEVWTFVLATNNAFSFASSAFVHGTSSFIGTLPDRRREPGVVLLRLWHGNP